MDGLFDRMAGQAASGRWTVPPARSRYFAEVTLDGVENPGPGLGNLAFDPLHRQVLRLRPRHRHDPSRSTRRARISTLRPRHRRPRRRGAARGRRDPAVACPTPAQRLRRRGPRQLGLRGGRPQVWGVAVHQGRLYYAVVDDSQIWSVGIAAEDGGFAEDPRWNSTSPSGRGSCRSACYRLRHGSGAMLLAQRGAITTWDYAGFADTGESLASTASGWSPGRPGHAEPLDRDPRGIRRASAANTGRPMAASTSATASTATAGSTSASARRRC